MDKARNSQHLEDNAKNLAEKDDKTLTRGPSKNLAEELDKDLTSREFNRTPAKKLANDLNARKFTKTPAEKLSNDNNGSDSYPLVDPRPEEAPDFEHGTVVQSTGADGSIVQTLNVMDKAPHSQHLGDDGSVTAKTVTAEDITAKDPAKKLAKDPDEKNSNKTLTEKHAKDHNAKKLTETLAEKFANDHIEAIEPRQGIQRARDITAKTITAKR